MDKTNYRLDFKVMWFLLIVILVATSSFIYKFYTVEDCPAIVYKLSDENIGVGEMIMFTNKTDGYSKVNWDFGDNSSIERASQIGHAYTQAGEYILKVTANGECSEFKRITVLPKKTIMDNSLIPKFAYPNVIEINKNTKFVALTEEADSYEWRFGETGKVDSNKRNPIYKFSTPGLKTVSLIINGNDKYIARRMIHVMTPIAKTPKRSLARKDVSNDLEEDFIPEAPTAWASYDSIKDQLQKKEEKPVKVLNDKDLLSFINSYSQDMAKSTDLKGSFCEGMEMTLAVSNGKVTKLPDFLNQISDKTLKIKDFRTIRGEGGCIMQIIIRFKIK